MSEKEIPLMKFESNVSAPLLRYDLPSPSSYEGRNYIELNIPINYFKEDYIYETNELSTLFDDLLNKFLIQNEELIREFLINFTLAEIEQDLYYFTLRQNEEIQNKISEMISKVKRDLNEKTTGLENVALTGTAKASSCISNINIHKIEHLNDGLYGNNYSWIAADTNAWIKIELPEPKYITKIVFGRDNAGGLSDRDPGNLDVYYSDDDVSYTICSNQVKKIQGTETTYTGELRAGQNAEYTFTPFTAKYIKLLTINIGGCIDEIEIYSPSSYELAFDEISPEFELKYQLFRYYIKLAWDLDMRFPVFYKTMGGTLKIRFIKIGDLRPRLMFIETHRLTTFPGDCGAGKAVKTFSLFPKEETEISVNTWKKTTTSIKEASSILDSYTEEKADDFEHSVQKESSKSSRVEESFAYNVEASAKTTFGSPPALGGSHTELSIKGGVQGSTNSARESMSKKVMNATEKHAQKASSKREVNIETSFERTEDMGEEIAITRKIENLNASRTLNFTFRQMNQQYHSLLHLIDLRLAFYNGSPGSMEEFELYELTDLVNKYFKNPKTIYNELKNSILEEYSNVIDYQGIPQKFLEEYVPNPINSTESINSSASGNPNISAQPIESTGSTNSSEASELTGSTESKNPNSGNQVPSILETFDFNDDEIGTKGNEIEFVDQCKSNEIVEITQDDEQHKKILKVIKSATGNYDNMAHNFGKPVKSGLIEFSLKLGESDKLGFLIFREGSIKSGTERLNLNFDKTSGFEVIGGDGKKPVCQFSINQWHQIRVQWYENNTFDVMCDNTKYITGESMRAPMNKGINLLEIRTQNPTIYFDEFKLMELETGVKATADTIPKQIIEAEPEITYELLSKDPNYLRVIPSREVNGKIIGRQKYIIREANEELEQSEDIRYLDGIIISNKVITMKTDGVIVEALLGQANALDDFSLDARQEKIREKKYENDLKKANVQKIMTGIEIINALIADGRHDDAITAYREIFGIQEGIKYFGEMFNQPPLEMKPKI